MNIIIERKFVENGAMWGMLKVYDAADTLLFWCFTGENSKALIDAGEYTMTDDHHGRFQWWAITGGDVGAPGSGAQREAIEVHPMNQPRIQSIGCVGLGEGIGRQAPRGTDELEMSLLESRPAHIALRKVIGLGAYPLLVVDPRA